MLFTVPQIFLSWAYSIIVSSPVACFTSICIFVASVSALRKLRSPTYKRSPTKRQLSRSISKPESFEKKEKPKEELFTRFVGYIEQQLCILNSFLVPAHLKAGQNTFFKGYSTFFFFCHNNCVKTTEKFGFSIIESLPKTWMTP